MNAVFFNQHGTPDVLTYGEFPTPTPGPDEVVVGVKACALNHLDIWIRMGIPGITVPLPHILGADVAGVIETVGSNVKNWKPSQKVIVAPGLSCGACTHCQGGNDHLCDKYDILGQQSNGGYADSVKVPANNLLPFPDPEERKSSEGFPSPLGRGQGEGTNPSRPLSFEEAASIPLTFLTAWQLLVTNGNVQPGQTVLVHAGGSGLGIACIQIAKLKGAHVITTVGSPEKEAFASRAFAHRENVERTNVPRTNVRPDDVINYRETDFQKEVLRITNNRGADLVVDHIGQETFEKSLNSVAKGGKLLTCGATSGRQIQFDLRTLFGRNITVQGTRMGRKSGLTDVLSHVEAGRLTPVIDSVYPLSDAAKAHQRMESRENFGKIVLIPSR
jgi:NADPH:quinone reductase-like Zn-dependent oxidoreductase